MKSMFYYKLLKPVETVTLEHYSCHLQKLNVATEGKKGNLQD